MALTTVYKERTFDDLVKPLLMYKAAYDEAEKEWEALATSSERLQRYMNTLDNSSSTKIRYNDYDNTRNSVYDDFTRGMTLSNKQALSNLKKRYIQDIKPMEESVDRIRELSDEQRKLKAANQDLMFDLDFSKDVTLDMMLENPELNYNTYNGRDIYTDALNTAKAKASRIINYYPGLGNQYYERAIGYGKEVADAWLLNESEAAPELQKAMKDIIASRGITEDMNIYNRAMEYARNGAYVGMAQDIKPIDNKAYLDPLSSIKAIAMNRELEQELINQGKLQGTEPLYTRDNGEKVFYDPETGGNYIKTPGVWEGLSGNKEFTDFTVYINKATGERVRVGKTKDGKYVKNSLTDPNNFWDKIRLEQFPLDLNDWEKEMIASPAPTSSIPDTQIAISNSFIYSNNAINEAVDDDSERGGQIITISDNLDTNSDLYDLVLTLSNLYDLSESDVIDFLKKDYIIKRLGNGSLKVTKAGKNERLNVSGSAQNESPTDPNTIPNN